MKKTKIVIQTDSYAMGGAEKYLMDVLPYLKDAGYEIKLICKDNKNINELKDFFGKLDCPVYLLPEILFTFSLIHIKKVLRLLLSADIVFVNKIDPTRSLTYVFWGAVLRKKIVCIEHLPGPVLSKYWFKVPILKFLIKIVMARANYIVCSTKQCKDYFVSYYHYLPDKIKVVSLGIDFPEKVNLSVKNSKRFVRIALIGRLCEQKGQLSFIDVVDRIVKNNSNRKFIVELWGEGELRSAIKNKIFELGLSRYVILRGRSLNKKEMYEDKDFIVIPSLNEAQCYVLLEAASFRLPAIAFDVGGMRNFIKNGTNGILIEPFDAVAFEKAVVFFINNTELCEKMGALAYDKVVNEHSKEQMVSKLWMLLNES